MPSSKDILVKEMRMLIQPLKWYVMLIFLLL
jgi:hypothetical protein